MTAPMEGRCRALDVTSRRKRANSHISEVDARVEQHTGPDSASRPSAPTRRATDGPGLAYAPVAKRVSAPADEVIEERQPYAGSILS